MQLQSHRLLRPRHVLTVACYLLPSVFWPLAEIGAVQPRQPNLSSLGALGSTLDLQPNSRVKNAGAVSLLQPKCQQTFSSRRAFPGGKRRVAEGGGTLAQLWTTDAK